MSKNDITGDRLISRPNTQAFNENFDRIFNKACEVCGGSGYIVEASDETRECCNCEGTGRIPVI